MPLRKVSTKPPQPKAMGTLPTASSSLKEELLKWICERHATNGPLDRQLLRDKALRLATTLGVTGFKCSEAWLTVFLKKHGFSPSLTNCSGPTFPDYRVWIDLLRSLITQYRHKDLFNVDELHMYSDFVPARVSSPPIRLEKTPENCADLSSRTNRICMLVCCNSSGTEKLPPLISGPYEVEDTRRDFRYHRDENSSINDDLFAEWLAALNQDMSSSGRKILLILSRDRIRSLRNTPRLSNVNLLFFPKDFPTQLRPLRGDVFHSVKMEHRSRCAERVRSAGGEWQPEEIVGSLARAWLEVPQELVVSSFQRTKFREDDTFLKIECHVWDCLGTGVSFRRFVTFDDDLSEASSGIPDDLQLSASNGHQYNLRRNRRGTVDLVVIDEVASINDHRGRKASKRSVIEETGSRAVAASNGHRSPSGSRKKQKMMEGIVSGTQSGRKESRASNPLSSNEISDRSSSGSRKKQKIMEGIVPEERQDDQQEYRASNSLSSNVTRDQSLVQTIDDFLESVADPSLEDEPITDILSEPSGSNINRENIDNLINEICQGSDNTRSLMERCLRAMAGDESASGLTDEYPRLRRSSDGNSTKEVEISGGTERGGNSFTSRDEETARRSRVAAGTSGQGPNTAEDTSGCDPPMITEFDDGDKEIPIAGRLSLKIIEAIECCDEIERSNAAVMNHLQAGDEGEDSRTTKRTRNVNDGNDDDDDDDDEPARKRARPEESWSKRYEKSFVFGPELRDSASQSVESSLEEPPAQNRGPATRSKKTQTRGSELEKRCIFTLDGNAPGVSYRKD